MRCVPSFRTGSIRSGHNMQADSILYQKTVAKDGERGDGPSILFVTKEVNFVVISIDDPQMGVVVIATDRIFNKDRMLAAGVKLGELPVSDIIELAEALSVGKQM